MSGTSPKPLEANRRNAQRSTGPQTPCDGVVAISDRGPHTIAHKPFRGWDDIPVERSAVAHTRRFRHVSHLSGGFSFKNAIERQLHRAINQLQRLQDHRCLSNPKPPETLPIDQN